MNDAELEKIKTTNKLVFDLNGDSLLSVQNFPASSRQFNNSLDLMKYALEYIQTYTQNYTENLKLKNTQKVISSIRKDFSFNKNSKHNYQWKFPETMNFSYFGKQYAVESFNCWDLLHPNYTVQEINYGDTTEDIQILRGNLEELKKVHNHKQENPNDYRLIFTVDNGGDYSYQENKYLCLKSTPFTMDGKYQQSNMVLFLYLKTEKIEQKPRVIKGLINSNF